MIKLTPLIETLRLEKIDDSEYFSQRYSNYVSNSRLGLINPDQEGSPEKFFSGFKPIYSAAFDLGSATHQMVLQPELFCICDTVDKPTAKMGALADRLYDLCKGEIPTEQQIKEQATIIDYYKGNLSDNQLQNVYDKCSDYWLEKRDFLDSYTGDKEVIFLDPKSREIVKNCVSALNSNTKIQKLLHPEGLIENPISECEQAILLDIKVEVDNHKPFAIRLKAKLDNYTIDRENNVICVNDVKTIGKIVSEMQGNIDKFHYNREFAFYSWLLSLCAKKYYGMNNPKVEGNYLVVSTIPGHYTKVISLTPKMFKKGWTEVTTLLRLVAKEVATNYPEFGYELE